MTALLGLSLTLLATHPEGVVFRASGGSIHRSLNFGMTWLSFSPLPGGSPLCFAFREDGAMFVGSTAGLHISEYATFWTGRALDSLAVGSVTVDRDGHLFVEADGGVLMSGDSGLTWTDISQGLPNGEVTSVAASVDGYLYAGTSSSGVFRTADVTTSINAFGGGGPENCNLAQNYPNPFNPSTTISFSIPRSSFINLSIFDLLGREVATIFNERLPAGTYTRQWDAAGLPSGVYFYRLRAGDFVETKKLLLLR